MGSLRPNENVKYTTEGNVTYGHYMDGERFIVGINLPKRRDPLDIKHNLDLWIDILDAGGDNPALQQAIDRVKMLYYLTKETPNG